MKIRKFHIYLADLSPRFGTESGKTRPVVVVQTNLLNEGHPSTMVCPITTQIVPAASILRVHLSKKENHLPKDSDILVDQVRAIDNARFLKKLGELTLTQRAQLIENLQILLLE